MAAAPLGAAVARIGSDLPNYLFQFSLCAIYACYFSLPPLFAIKFEVVTSPSLFERTGRPLGDEGFIGRIEWALGWPLKKKKPRPKQRQGD